MPTIITASDDLQWPVDAPCGDGDGPEFADDAQWARAQALATAWVWALSGRRYGLRPVVYRPEWTVLAGRRRDCFPYALGDLAYLPAMGGSDMKPVTVAPLPGPVNSDAVTEVLVDGAAVDPAAYIVQRNQLIRIDGGTWPAYQNTATPVTEVGTWQVSYNRGLIVPEGGQFAVGVLACELAKAICGKNCRLPSNAVSVARNGVNVSLDASQIQKAFTTITEVDQWCRQVNPGGAAEQPFVWSPDLDPDLHSSLSA